MGLDGPGREHRFVWDIDGLLDLDRYVQLVRDAGALAELPTPPLRAGHRRPRGSGDFAGAASLIAEADERRGGDRKPLRRPTPR